MRFLPTGQYAGLTQREVDQLEYGAVVELFRRQLRTDCGRQLIGRFMVRPLADLGLIRRRQAYLAFVGSLGQKERVGRLRALNGLGSVCRRLFGVNARNQRQLAGVPKLALGLWQYARDDVGRLLELCVDGYDAFAASLPACDAGELVPELAELRGAWSPSLDAVVRLVA